MGCLLSNQNARSEVIVVLDKANPLTFASSFKIFDCVQIVTKRLVDFRICCTDLAIMMQICYFLFYFVLLVFKIGKEERTPF